MKKDMISGLTACVIIGMLAKLASVILPLVGSTSLAIIIGIIAGNTLAKDKKYIPGVKFAEKTILPGAIMLLGATLHLSAITSLGIKGIFFILLEISLVIGINLVIGRSLGFSKNFSLLMGAGNAVCGSSAIAATAPVLGAKEDEIGIPVAVINLIGTIFMFILPAVAFNILGYTPMESGGLIGGGLQSVGQVVAGGNFLGEETGKFSILFKMIRISMLGGVVLIFSLMNNKNLNNINPKKNKLPVPPFIIGFILLSILATLGFLNNQMRNILGFLSNNLLLVAMAGIGMRVKFKELLSEGPKALLFGIIAMFSQIALLIILIKLILK
ncbi:MULTISPECIES: YeiH family protein [Psychrilyobacter]|uniref:Sulfate exporter family transporter n=1 Tax=Psychrilyobacter piezotolerans TaxID=2293438 RepID=A0ABX9KFV1_9FUSO|nr:MULTISPECIES: putative sulfate exporter family transporter [Psychrilyobacter]MCS5422469.1 putative sulfate exporter family transporter [Psychrilyobacter sp. S5]NDI78367.1 putative sulfate exporter family transporter [Psychrilyobacter piezotolerans]RDE61094.1 putative sulfate exporter family transporter [Psychrilyobacter sp. S5]REI40735.1 putative sulfate exporter family transporter [Psychrilyobacter piezotolerans]